MPLPTRNRLKKRSDWLVRRLRGFRVSSGRHDVGDPRSRGLVSNVGFVLFALLATQRKVTPLNSRSTPCPDAAMLTVVFCPVEMSQRPNDSAGEMTPVTPAVPTSPGPGEKRHSALPSDTPVQTNCDRYLLLFRQGLLPAVQMTLSPISVLLGLLCSAILGIVLGVVIVTAADGTTQMWIRYDDKQNYVYPITAEAIAKSSQSGGINFTAGGQNFTQGVMTTVEFTIDSRVNPPIYLSYGLTEFYQNYRFYTMSVSNLQLLGQSVPFGDLSGCAPFRSPTELRTEIGALTPVRSGSQYRLYGDMIYLPCGALPWSMFNDSITLSRVDKATDTATLVCNASDFAPTGERLTMSSTQNPCEKNGIAWPSDRERRFRAQPSQFLDSGMWTGRGRANKSNDDFLTNGWYAKEAGHTIPDPLDEDLMVWLRVATLPTFRKLHRIITTPLTPGTYRLSIREFFPTAPFGGKKYVVLNTYSWVGGKDYVLGYLLLGGGAVSLALVLGFFARYMIRREEQRAGPHSGKGQQV
jgi:hypothetical protein